jgi:hypothetical protein
MKQIILFLFIFITTISFIQAGNPIIPENTNILQITIKGKVIDKNTKEALVGASININNSKDIIYTDLEGNFETKIIKQDNYSIVISYISYDSSLIEYSILNDNLLNIELIDNNK